MQSNLSNIGNTAVSQSFSLETSLDGLFEEAVHFWQRIGSRYGEARRLSHAILRAGRHLLSHRVLSQSEAPFGHFLFSLTISRVGRAFVMDALPTKRFEHALVQVRESNPMALQPAGVGDVTTLRDIPRFVDALSFERFREWLHGRLLSSTSDDGGSGARACLSLLSLNIAGLPPLLTDSELSAEGRFNRIAAELRRHPHDIVVLQEMWNKRSPSILEKLPEYFVANRGDAGSFFGSSGLVTLSRHPILLSVFYPFSRQSGLEKSVQKGALLTRIALPDGRRVDVWNVHFASEPERANRFFVGRSTADEIRGTQFSELRGWIAGHAQDSTPLIVAGDFNVDEEAPGYAELLGFGALDVYRARIGSPECALDDADHEFRKGYTFDPYRNPWAKSPRDARERIDYVLLGGALHPSLGASLLWREDPISDHYGVSTQFCFS